MNEAYVPWTFNTRQVLLVLKTEVEIDILADSLSVPMEMFRRDAKEYLNTNKKYEHGVVVCLVQRYDSWAFQGWCSLSWYNERRFYDTMPRIHLSDLVCNIKYDDEFEALFA